MKTEDDILRNASDLINRTLRYKESARGDQRGFARLHRIIDARNQEIKDLMEFISGKQLAGEFAEFDKKTRMERRAKREYFKTRIAAIQ